MSHHNLHEFLSVNSVFHRKFIFKCCVFLNFSLNSNTFSVLSHLLHDKYAYSRHAYSIVPSSCLVVVFHINSLCTFHPCLVKNRVKSLSSSCHSFNVMFCPYFLSKIVLYSWFLDLHQVFRDHVHKVIYHVLKYKLIDAYVWFVFYVAFLNIKLLNLMCISLDYKIFNPSLGEVGFLEEFLDRTYKMELLGKCSNIILVFKDTNCCFYFVGYSRTNSFKEGENDRKPCVSSCDVPANFEGLNYSC